MALIFFLIFEALSRRLGPESIFNKYLCLLKVDSKVNVYLYFLALLDFTTTTTTFKDRTFFLSVNVCLLFLLNLLEKQGGNRFLWDYHTGF